MPQRTLHHPLLTSLRREATKALATLRQEITQREQELSTLKAEATRWQRVLRPPARGVGPAVIPQVLLPKRPQLDWGAILKKLPTRFMTKDVAQEAGKPIDQVYVHLSRWMKDKKVRRVKDGYEKVSQAE